MKLAETKGMIKNEIRSVYDEPEAVNISRLIIEHLTGYTNQNQLLKKDEEFGLEKMDRLREMISRLKKNEPIQYILNKSWFYGLELYVDKNVLIPRPETEELVDWIVSDLKISGKDIFIRKSFDSDQTDIMKILDVGTGSGCIALALKSKITKAEIWGCDKSEGALTVARRNASHLDLRVDFQGLDFLDHLQQKQLPSVDILVSNPPYIPKQDAEKLHANVVEFEPALALFVPDEDPLVFYRAIADFGKHRLHKNGMIYMEIHEDLSREVCQLFEQNEYKEIELRKDMQGKERMVRVASVKLTIN